MVSNFNINNFFVILIITHPLPNYSAQHFDMFNKRALQRQNANFHTHSSEEAGELGSRGAREKNSPLHSRTPAPLHNYQPRVANCSSSGRLLTLMPTIGSPRFSLTFAKISAFM